MSYIKKLLVVLSSLLVCSNYAFGQDFRLPEFRRENPRLSDFKRAAIEHARFQACFNSKLRTGYCSIDDHAHREVERLSGEELEEQIVYRLRQLSQGTNKTAALVYFEASDRSLSIFLFDESGLVSRSTKRKVNLEDMILGMRSGLNIDVRAARQAVDSETRKFGPANGGAAQISLSEISELMLPNRIGEKIESREYNRLLILPSGATSAVPYSALFLPSGQQVVDIASIVILPDLDALTLPLGAAYGKRSDLADALTFEGTAAARNHALVIGDPDYAFYKGLALSALPGARLEAQTIAGSLQNAQLLIGEDANHDAVVSALKSMQYDGGLVYFASHGVSDSENPMSESLIALSQKHLLAQEIRDLRFGTKHPLVVLSACQTGLGKQFGGGTFGLLRAWYHAGAGQVVGSLWNVDDTGTLNLMSEFASLTENENQAEEALRQAMLKTRSEYSSDPAIWASFYVFGNPTK